jgi:ABC-type dipeptide/oligopeptide/nickel transport system permease component
MLRYILNRLIWMIPVILGVSILIFTIMYFVPGDPAQIALGSQNVTPADVAAKRTELGLDRPYTVRLATYLEEVFLHFNFGKSYVNGTSVTHELLVRFPRTLILALSSILLSLVIGIPLGIYAAVHLNTAHDQLAMLIALVGVSVPSFWFGILLVIEFSVNLHLLPSSGLGGFKYYILPCIANSFMGIAIMARQTRSSVLEVIRSDYIVTSRAKGVSQNVMLYRHALPNALIPIITMAGQGFGFQIAGSLIVESVFAIPGVGMYLITAVNNRDYAAVQGAVIFIAIAFSIIMLLTDLLYAFVDPRIKAQFEGSKRRKAHAS